jgi:hypothetical protein
VEQQTEEHGEDQHVREDGQHRQHRLGVLWMGWVGGWMGGWVGG